jgi:amino-acid N-acetyltransferase
VIGSSHPVIRRGHSSDLPAVAALLREAKLPTQELASASGLRVWVLEIEGKLAGAVALQGTDPTSRLLRSLVIAPSRHRRGLGQALVAHVESDASALGIGLLVLLTETAQALFHRLGYQVIERSAVPEALRQSAEFRSLCPASAVCMSKALRPRHG